MNTKYETDRLLLCVCKTPHAPMIADFYKRNYEDFALYEPLQESAMTAAFHRGGLTYEYRLFKAGKYLRLYLFEKQNPLKVIGTVSYRDMDKRHGKSCVIGYKIDKDYRRMGYCREAILRGNKIMFDELGIKRIEATVQPENIPSLNLLTSMGFVNEGLLEDGIIIGTLPQDHFLLSLDIAEIPNP